MRGEGIFLSIFFFAIFAAVNFVFRIGEDKDMIQFLLDGGNAARIFAFDHIGDLGRQGELLLA